MLARANEANNDFRERIEAPGPSTDAYVDRLVIARQTTYGLDYGVVRGCGGVPLTAHLSPRLRGGRGAMRPSIRSAWRVTPWPIGARGGVVARQLKPSTNREVFVARLGDVFARFAHGMRSTSTVLQPKGARRTAPRGRGPRGGLHGRKWRSTNEDSCYCPIVRRSGDSNSDGRSFTHNKLLTSRCTEVLCMPTSAGAISAPCRRIWI
jgi:hypothetical protein